MKSDPRSSGAGAVDRADPFVPSQPDAGDPLVAKLQEYGLSLGLAWAGVSIVLPTVLAAIYFLLIAAPQYVSEFRAVIKPADAAALNGSAPLAGTGSMVPGLIMIQSNIVVQYVKSPDMVQELQRRMDMRAIYAQGGDVFSRLSSDVSDDRLQAYWNGKVDPFFDTTTGLLSVRVKAFTPQDAQRLAQGVISVSQQMVNDISRRAQTDGVRSTDQEQKLALQRLTNARQALANFQSQRQSMSPEDEVKNNMSLLSRLEEERGRSRSALNFYRDASDAPAAMILRNRIGALDAQIAGLSGKPGPQPDASLSSRLRDFQALDAERLLAEKAYELAVNAQDRARYEAGRQTTYLDVFVKPSLPRDAAYPRRWEDILLTFLGGCVLWLFGAVVYRSVRDHV